MESRNETNEPKISKSWRLDLSLVQRDAMCQQLHDGLLLSDSSGPARDAIHSLDPFHPNRPSNRQRP